MFGKGYSDGLLSFSFKNQHFFFDQIRDSVKEEEKMKIPFNIPPYVGTEEKYILKAIEKRKICGDGEYTKKCNAWLEKKTGSPRVMLTTS